MEEDTSVTSSMGSADPGSVAGCGNWAMGHGSALCWSLVPIQSSTQLLSFRPREGFLLNSE